MEVVDLAAGCCGMAGTFGMKTGTYDLSMLTGAARSSTASRRSAPDLVASECSTCRMQIAEATSVADSPPGHAAGRRPTGSKNSIQNEVTPAGRDGRVRGKDAGSARSSATCATEDDASCRSVRTRRPQLHFESSCKPALPAAHRAWPPRQPLLVGVEGPGFRPVLPRIVLDDHIDLVFWRPGVLRTPPR